MTEPTEPSDEDDRESLIDATLGVLPKDFNANVELAREITDWLAKWELEYSKNITIDSLIITALAQYVGNAPGDETRNPIGFSIRARQIVKWLIDRPEALDKRLERVHARQTAGKDPRQDLDLLKNKTTEVARVISTMMYKDEGFILLIFKDGPEGWTTHASSATRETQINLLKQHVAMLEHLEATKKTAQ